MNREPYANGCGPDEADCRKEGLDLNAVNELFEMEPANDLTDPQKVRRALFPRWEVIIPAEFDPVQEENRMIAEILDEAENVEPTPWIVDQGNNHPPVH